MRLHIVMFIPERKPHVLPVFLLLMFLPCLSTSAKTASGVGEWTGLIKTAPFSQNSFWLYGFLLETRLTTQFNPNVTTWQNLIQGQVGYQTSPLTRLWLGFTYIPNQAWADNISQTVYVRRAYQQIEFRPPAFSSYAIWTRTRLEERAQNGQNNLNWRLRQLLEVDLNELMLAQRYRPFISDEIFVNLNQPTWVNQNIMHQNRAMVGVDFTCFGQHLCRIAYLNQYSINQPDNAMNHIVYTSLTI